MSLQTVTSYPPRASPFSEDDSQSFRTAARLQEEQDKEDTIVDNSFNSCVDSDDNDDDEDEAAFMSHCGMCEAMGDMNVSPWTRILAMNVTNWWENKPTRRGRVSGGRRRRKNRTLNDDDDDVSSSYPSQGAPQKCNSTEVHSCSTAPHSNTTPAAIGRAFDQFEAVGLVDTSYSTDDDDSQYELRDLSVLQKDGFR